MVKILLTRQPRATGPLRRAVSRSWPALLPSRTRHPNPIIKAPGLAPSPGQIVYPKFDAETVR